MKKQQKQIWVLLAMLAIFVGAFFGIRKYNEAQSEKPARQEGTVVLDVSADDVIRYTYDYEGETYTLEKEGDTWYAAGDHTRNLYQYRAGSLMEGIAPLIATQVIENVSDLAQYGLTEPQRTISYETATGSYTIYVGDRNSVTASYYVSLPSDSRVYVVDADAITKFNVALEEMVNETPAETDESTEAEEAVTESKQEVSETME